MYSLVPFPPSPFIAIYSNTGGINRNLFRHLHPRLSSQGFPVQRSQLLWFSYRKLWRDPSEFQPERFLTANGTAINKTLLFGLDKCQCIGEGLAKWEVFLFLAILLQQLEVSVLPGVKVDLTLIYWLTMKHAHCEHVQAQLHFSIKWRRYQHAEAVKRMAVTHGPQPFFLSFSFLITVLLPYNSCRSREFSPSSLLGSLAGLKLNWHKMD